MCPVPTYEVKLSKKHNYQQQRGLDWLRRSTKDAFDIAHANLLTRWGGVKVSHEGTCVLCPGDWQFLKPSSLRHFEDVSALPSRHSDRLMFQYGDHTTTFLRALAWFGDQTWPRNGIELDNFLSCGPYKPMDASHLCHHDHCLVHVVYESTDINQTRKSCHQQARDLRASGLDIPGVCDKHSPPCLLQVCVLPWVMWASANPTACCLDHLRGVSYPIFHPSPGDWLQLGLLNGYAKLSSISNL